MKKTVLILLSALLCLTLILPAVAEYPVPGEDVPTDKAQTVFLHNLDNDITVFQKTPPSGVIFPSSTVKIMSGLIACERLSARLDEVFSVTAEMINGATGKKCYLAVGDKLSVRDALYLAFCGSFNDAVYTVASITSGSHDAFVSEMNSRAAELGMTSTTYKNPTGIHDPMMKSSPEDILRLCSAAAKNELLTEITSTAKYQLEQMKMSVTNTNPMVGVTGRGYRFIPLNSGYTDEGGYCLVTLAEGEELSYLCVVMGGEEKSADIGYNADIASALTAWGFDNFGEVTVIEAGRIIAEVPIELSLEIESVTVAASESSKRFLPLSTKLGKDINYEFIYDSESFDAPIKEGERVGIVNAIMDGEVIASSVLVTSFDVEQSRLLVFFRDVREFTASRVFRASVIAAVVLTVLYAVIGAIRRGSRFKTSKRR